MAQSQGKISLNLSLSISCTFGEIACDFGGSVVVVKFGVFVVVGNFGQR